LRFGPWGLKFLTSDVKTNGRVLYERLCRNEIISTIIKLYL